MVKILENNSGFNQWMKNQAAAKNEAKPSLVGSVARMTLLFAAAFMAYSYFFGEKPVQIVDVVAPEIAEQAQNLPVKKLDGDKISFDVSGARISNVALRDFPDVVLLANENEFIEVASTDNVISRDIKIDGYTIVITDTVRGDFTPHVKIVRDGVDASAMVETGAVSYTNGDIEYASFKSLDKKSSIYQTVSGFAGFADTYWETIAFIDAPDQTITAKKIGGKYQTDISAAQLNSDTAITKIFVGPRDPKILAASGIADLSETMDYGWFWFLSQPFLWALNALHGFVLNYGVAIILLTIALRILMWPLTRKSYTSMAAMQKMQPELAKIQKLYANDKARMQMEMMRLYQSHKTSPMSGCLPMLLQIPIFFALYKALLISVPMRQAGFLWIGDLSVMDPYFILPIIMGATMWYQQKLQSSGDVSGPAAQMQKMMKWMPVIFTVMFAWMPAGLVLYWTVSNLFGIGQMLVIKRQQS